MGKRSKERRDTCILMADSLCRTEETDIEVHSNYTPKKRKKKRNKFTFVKKQLELMVTKRVKVMDVRMNWETGMNIHTILCIK